MQFWLTNRYSKGCCDIRKIRRHKGESTVVVLKLEMMEQHGSMWGWVVCGFKLLSESSPLRQLRNRVPYVDWLDEVGI